ncbi:MAG: ABC transporter permease [Pseudomonadota bacterium]
MDPIGFGAIFARAFVLFWPVWIALSVVMIPSFLFRKQLGLYGSIYTAPLGIFGLFLVMFWVFTALFAELIAPLDPLAQISGMKRAIPGSFVGDESLPYDVYLFGGDNLARDVFSRVVIGSQTVLAIAPVATLFAFMVGITLGLPAGFYGGRIDTVLTFLANLVLAFPVILLFYLLVTPGIRETGIPIYMAGVLFLFPIVFFAVFFYSRYSTQPQILRWQLAAVFVLGAWMYAGLTFNADPLGILSMDANTLNIFVSVVFVNSPTVFRIVRGLTLDIKTRDYVAAAQTRGEKPAYIMLWEILPNARGPLIVDLCLRIGYTTILLGTLGFFGLGVSPESPDWGLSINEGRQIWRSVVHVALPPALALMTLVLGLNLLADSLREQSLKD